MLLQVFFFFQKIVVDIGFIQKVVERLQSEKRPEFLPLLMICKLALRN